jgi:hypothetical protein
MSQSLVVRWHCTDRSCRFAFIATTPPKSDGIPRCLCGKAMKKVEPAGVFGYLDFLRENTPEGQEAGTGKE